MVRMEEACLWMAARLMARLAKRPAMDILMESVSCVDGNGLIDGVRDPKWSCFE